MFAIRYSRWKINDSNLEKYQEYKLISFWYGPVLAISFLTWKTDIIHNRKTFPSQIFRITKKLTKCPFKIFGTDLSSRFTSTLIVMGDWLRSNITLRTQIILSTTNCYQFKKKFFFNFSDKCDNRQGRSEKFLYGTICIFIKLNIETVFKLSKKNFFSIRGLLFC